MVETDFGSCDLDVCGASRKGKHVLLGKDLVWAQHSLEGNKSPLSFTFTIPYNTKRFISKRSS